MLGPSERLRSCRGCADLLRETGMPDAAPRDDAPLQPQERRPLPSKSSAQIWAEPPTLRPARVARGNSPMEPTVLVVINLEK